jgi:crotonobetainyl-CoA:carnitine CoA-transferase CaiB-like acyl-CoA transferase
MGVEEFGTDPRFGSIRARAKGCQEIISVFDKQFAAKPRDEWMHILKNGGDFIYTVVNTIDELPDDPQMIANDYVVDYDHPVWGPSKVVGVPVRFSKTPGNPKAPAPEFGEHTEQILIDTLGYSWEDISRLKEEEVI